MSTDSPSSPVPGGWFSRWSGLTRPRKCVLVSLLLLSGAAGTAVLWTTRSVVPAEVERSQLTLHDGTLFIPGSSRPYSGLLVAEYTGTAQRKSALPVQEGRINGIVRSWHPNGTPEVEEHFKNGISHGLRVRWHENGTKRSETEIVQGKLQGRYTDWYPNGRKAVEMTLADGKAEGLAESWHPGGRLKSRAQMLHGDVKERQFFADDAASTPVNPGETASVPDAHD